MDATNHTRITIFFEISSVYDLPLFAFLSFLKIYYSTQPNDCATCSDPIVVSGVGVGRLSLPTPPRLRRCIRSFNCTPPQTTAAQFFEKFSRGYNRATLQTRGGTSHDLASDLKQVDRGRVFTSLKGTHAIRTDRPASSPPSLRGRASLHHPAANAALFNRRMVNEKF